MARIIERKSELAAAYRRAQVLKVTGKIFCLIGNVLFVELLCGRYSLLGALLSAVIGFIGAIMYYLSKDSTGVLGGGDEGEKKALSMIAQALPDTYTCINNVNISAGNHHNELDIIVVGPTGVFIVEIKNIKGKIKGSYTDEYWRQEQSDGVKQMYNPVLQVNGHKKTLERYLRAKGVRTSVKCAVFVVHPKADLYIDGLTAQGTPVYAVCDMGLEMLVDYITIANNALSQEEIERICNLI